MQLGKYFGFTLNKLQQQTLNENYFKNKDNALPIKEKLNYFLMQVINLENDIHLTQQQQITQSEQYYKYFIGTGNNSLLVKGLMKQRWWWYQKDMEKYDIEELNLIWTSWRKNKIVNQLKTLKQINDENCEQLQTTNGDLQNSLSINSSFALSQSPQNIMKQSNGYITQTTMTQTEKSHKQNQNTFTFKQHTQQQDQFVGIQSKLYSKLECNFHLSNKKALFLNMRSYYEAVQEDISLSLPLTFHIKALDDPEYHKFKEYFQKIQDEAISSQQKVQNIWIIKPGENTNRGQGIEVRKELNDITTLIQQYSNKKRTAIVQRYIHNPLLINKRKFDIRCYALVTSVKGNLKAYFYRDGYLRTSSKEFSLNNLQNRMVHLTNDAVQKHAEDYGKFEAGNKLSYDDFQKILTQNYSNLKIDFYRDLLPQIQKLVTDSIRATFSKLDPNKRVNSFEIFGYDFMFDDQFKIYLIESNTNPCLELSSPLLAKLIPHMVDNAFRIAIDPLFTPPENYAWKKSMLGDICQENKFELIFDDKIDGPILYDLLKEKEKIIIEIDEDDEDLEDDCDE